MILVTGATGNIGRELVRCLASQGQRARALVRDPGKASLPDGVEAFVGDLDRPSTLAPALDGATGLFLLSGYADTPGILAEAKRAGVERVALLSSSSAPTRNMENAVARYHIESQDAVRASGLAWTFLQPNAFMSNTFRWRSQLREGDTLRLPFADVRTATIDPYDIAAVAAAALTSSAHAGKEYRLTGPESLLPAEQLAIVAAALGRKLTLVPYSNAEARVELGKTMPTKYVDAFFDFYVAGNLDESQVLPTVEEILGRRPGTYARWVDANVSSLR